jgi:hypothetical protein
MTGGSADRVHGQGFDRAASQAAQEEDWSNEAS